MVIRYSKLISENVYTKCLRWANSRLPMAFLRQQKALVTLVIVSGLMLILTLLLTPSDDHSLPKISHDLNYAIIVDCGSSGSRAHIFSWKDDPKAMQIELVRNKIDGKPLTKHITPGLSSLRDEPEKASEYMEPIMDFVSNHIPPERHLDTPIHFMATAGLRLLEASIQKKILSSITRNLRAKYNFPNIKSQVISGQYEGVYSWLSINKQRIANPRQSISRSFGMIEIGGASTQVTFELDPKVENAILKNLKGTDAIAAFKSEQTTFETGPNSSVRLFAATFLGLGVNSARESAIDLMVRDYLNGLDNIESVRSNPRNFELRLKDPCLNVGSSEIIPRPKELLLSKHQSIGLTVKSADDTLKVHLEGVGNFLHCLNLLDRVLQIVKEEKLNCPAGKQICPMALLGTDFIPYAYYPFVGLSEMFFTTNEIINSAGHFNRTKIIYETQKVCSTPYNTMLETYSNKGVTHQDRILYECFKASWLLNIMHESGFRMPEAYDNLQTLDRLDGEEIDWTIGAMMREVAFRKSGS